MSHKPDLRRFVVEYELDYKHRVQVGVEAGSSEEALAVAEQSFNAGSIWDNTAEMPLLFDDYEEAHDESPLDFRVISTVQEWPAPDASVLALQRDDSAMLAARYLVDAVNRANRENRPVEWQKAYGAALAALGAS